MNYIYIYCCQQTSSSLRTSLRLSTLKRTFNSIFMLKINQQCWIDHCSNHRLLIEIIHFNCFNSSMSDLMNSINLDSHFLLTDFYITIINFLTSLTAINFLIIMNNEITVSRIRTAVILLKNYINTFCWISYQYFINHFK